ncbi:MAG: hypothetical protein A3C44_05660 [Gammaproteobacteria bacterium RIFCSPHIGHO2_02_FULL_39_13]|nr:MAG: hypothetical protein A3C44_05660 [Gammaproteobacteria bacterium RIFCSPHIGHO2_02_FULL_39_13]OGT48544.1 MAG: hypothetical protein A3E53_04125 [Gammaproteobacteria bacterium RIFCSPHIGHO2_12_FULL_39_24]
MKLAINAFNIRIGGGITHLVELLSAAKPEAYGFSEVAVWSNEDTINLLPDRPWLKKISVPAFSKSFFHKLWWNARYFSRELKNYDIFFVPGGTYLGKFKPFVNMFQNALPFEPKEKRRFLLTSPLFYIKWNLLQITQGLTFKRTQGAIFPSYYLKSLISKKIKSTDCHHAAVIPHGINPVFFQAPRIENETLLEKKIIRVVYVSRVDFYKHQWHVVTAIKLLRDMHIPVELDLCGYVGNHHALIRLNSAIKKADPTNSFIRYHGHLDYDTLPALYKRTDIFIFASSCESISSILLEGMASSLAIACSKMPVAEEVLKDAGVYFNPENPREIKTSVHQLIVNNDLRQRCMQKSYQYAKEYSWNTCADNTLSFLEKIAVLNKKK